MEDFYFGNHWLSEFGGRLADVPQKEIAEYDFELVEKAGRSGDLYLDNNRFKNVPFSRKIKLANKKRLPNRQQIDKFIGWIAYLRGYQEFRDTQHPGAFSRAVLQNVNEIVRNLPRLTETTLNFNRESYWYTDEGQQEVVLKRGETAFEATLYNPEGLDASADFIIKSNPCNIEILIGVNGSNRGIEVEFTSDYNTLKVDTQLGQVFLYDSDMLRRKTIDADFPDLLKAKEESEIKIMSFNSISDLDYIQSAKIIPNWRHL